VNAGRIFSQIALRLFHSQPHITYLVTDNLQVLYIPWTSGHRECKLTKYWLHFDRTERWSNRIAQNFICNSFWVCRFHKIWCEKLNPGGWEGWNKSSLLKGYEKIIQIMFIKPERINSLLFLGVVERIILKLAVSYEDTVGVSCFIIMLLNLYWTGGFHTS